MTPSEAVITSTPTAPVEVNVGDTVYIKTSITSATYTVRNTSVLRLLSSTSRRARAIAPGKTYVIATSADRKKDSTLVIVRGATSDPIQPSPTQPVETAPVAPGNGAGLWISASELAARPTSGSAWTSLKAAADRSCGTLNLADQNQNNNVCIMAKALVFARTGQPAYRDGVVSAIRTITRMGKYEGRSLALGRELAAYVISADLIGLKSYDATLDQQFRSKLMELRKTYTSGAADNLIHCHESRPNNWGTMCGATRVAIAAYLGERAELDRAAQVFRGYLGERSAYAQFDYGDDLSWQCDPARPVGINPKGCVKSGVSLDGVLPDDQRRGGRFAGSVAKEPYVYEALQGAVAQAHLLSRQGYDVWNWGDKALLRAFTWLHSQARFPAEGDDTWQPHLINRVYGTSFPAPLPARAGKNVGWTDWTHGR